MKKKTDDIFSHTHTHTHTCCSIKVHENIVIADLDQCKKLSHKNLQKIAYVLEVIPT